MTSGMDGIEAAPPIQYMIFQRIERPKKTFFYQRISQKQFGEELKEVVIGDSPQDDIFACGETEAARLHAPPHLGKVRQIGVGDGSAYYKSLAGCGVKVGDRITVEKGQKILQDALKAELEVARGHHEMPKKVFVFTPDGTVPDQIIAGFKP